jgi:hypothetical protein
MNSDNILNNDLKILVNVYKQNYQNAPGGGIGDFIRGCFFLLQISMINNKRFDIDYTKHPISKYLYKKYNIIDESQINYDNVLYYYPDNDTNCNTQFFLNNFYEYLNNIKNNEFYFYSNNYPIYKITNVQKNIIKDKFIPNDELNEYINYNMKKLNILPYNFSVIHIRVNDEIFENDVNILNNKSLKQLITTLKYIFYNKNNYKKNNYLLLSNSNSIKKIMKRIFPNLIINLNNISHLGKSNDDNYIKDTLCDFFIMSKSNRIFSFSTYEHGTGFSKYCSIIFDIEYYFKLLV